MTKDNYSEILTGCKQLRQKLALSKTRHARSHRTKAPDKACFVHTHLNTATIACHQFCRNIRE